MLLATIVGVFVIPGLFAHVEGLTFGKKKPGSPATPAAEAPTSAH